MSVDVSPTVVEWPAMPASEYDVSATDLSLVTVFQLGFCLPLLAEVADATRGYGTLLGLAGYVVGGPTAVGAALTLLVRRRVGQGQHLTRARSVCRLIRDVRRSRPVLGGSDGRSDRRPRLIPEECDDRGERRCNRQLYPRQR
jgi:hypothetical protein